jgi:hypothetical protein
MTRERRERIAPARVGVSLGDNPRHRVLVGIVATARADRQSAVIGAVGQQCSHADVSS